MKSGVYRILNTINGKCYIGSAVNIVNRWCEHRKGIKAKSHSQKLQNAFNKYGEDNFVFSIIERCAVEELLSREQYWIDHLDSYKNGYNTRPKAESSLCFNHSKQTKKKMSEPRKEMRRSEETKLKISQSHNERLRKEHEARRAAREAGIYC